MQIGENSVDLVDLEHEFRHVRKPFSERMISL
jgi:hypothetical protein